MLALPNFRHQAGLGYQSQLATGGGLEFSYVYASTAKTFGVTNNWGPEPLHRIVAEAKHLECICYRVRSEDLILVLRIHTRYEPSVHRPSVFLSKLVSSCFIISIV